jgi:hypothetical protein
MTANIKLGASSERRVAIVSVVWWLRRCEAGAGILQELRTPMNQAALCVELCVFAREIQRDCAPEGSAWGGHGKGVE